MRDFSKEFVSSAGETSTTETWTIKQRGDIFDLAKAFLYISSMTNKKLQKLCFYAKAWYLALYDENLISEPFEAWVHGAVQPSLYQKSEFEYQ